MDAAESWHQSCNSVVNLNSFWSSVELQCFKKILFWEIHAAMMGDVISLPPTVLNDVKWSALPQYLLHNVSKSVG